jgi:predicted dienelactone hydrolase
MTAALTRRHLLTAAIASGIAVPLGAAGRATAATRDPVRLTLPRPTGPYPIGTAALHLFDASRDRDLMASVWYPAGRNAWHRPRVPWLAAAPTEALLASVGFAPDIVASPLTAGHDNAQVRPGRHPVILFSHGAHDHRSDTTIVVQELASHGYVVVTVDHTGDAYTQFPDGRLGVPEFEPGLVPSDFALDVRFVLDRVEDLAAGRNPDVDHHRLPAGLGTVLDLHRIGMFGWSKGGTATALAMIDDRRIRAGLSLDGPMECRPPISADIDRPFMMMTADFTRAADPSAAAFWSHLRGWRLNLQIDDAYESSFADSQWLVPQVAKVAGMSDQEVVDWIGPLDPARALKIQQAYPLAFFDRHLRGRRSPLLNGPSPAFPEVRFIP